jgi:hypothetical protein
VKTRKKKRARTEITPNLPSTLPARLAILGLSLLLFLPTFSSQQSSLAAQLDPRRPALYLTASSDKDKPYALIFGTVWGPDDRPVYGITVKIRKSTDKKPKWEVHSDHHGEFAQRVPAGEADYILTADLKHVKTTDGRALHQAQEVKVHVYGEEREDTGLHLTY